MKKGFTLVELFLVASLMGLILLTIFSTYVSGIKIMESVKEMRLNENRNFYMGMVKVIRDFEDINFEGEEEELSFPCVFNNEIVKVAYQFKKNRKSFLRKVVKYSDSLKDKMDEKITRLFDADKIEINYLFYDIETEDESGNWITSFSEEDDGVPAAIRFDIKINDKEFTEYVFLPR